MVPGRCCQRCLPGAAALAGWFHLPSVRGVEGLAAQVGLLDVLVLREEDLGDGGHNLPPFSHLDLELVRGSLVHHLAEDRDLRPGPATPVRIRLLRDGVGVDAEVTPGDGAP